MSDRKTLTGAQMVWESLLQEGVDVVFGYPGGSVIDVYDAMLDYPIRHILVRHEQGAGHAADAYARTTGKVGVCIATSGPGATNLVTGIATAYMDSVPMVAITGQVSTKMIGRDAFQEADITGITLPITKHNFLISDISELTETFAEAFHIARTGRQGPVLIDLPRDVAQARAPFDYPTKRDMPGYRPTTRGNMRQLRMAAELMNSASRPLILAGAGINRSGAFDELLQLAAKYRAPVAMTLLGLGGFPASHEQALGFIGMHGSAAANHTADSADLIIALGMRFSDRDTGNPSAWAPNARVIHVDVDPAEIGKNIVPTVPIVGDVRLVLSQLLPLVQDRSFDGWWEGIREWQREEHERDILQRPHSELLPPYVINRISELTNGQALMVSDVGQNQMWEAQYYRHELPRSLSTSGGLGTMGYAAPAALGVQVGNPDALVWAVAGDGGFQMTMNQMGTMAEECLPIKMAVLNNSYLGMVRQWQEMFFDRRYAATPISSPDFVKVAEAYGIPGVLVTAKDQVDDAIKAALAYPGPFLIEFRVKGEENVYPMVPSGKTIRDMIRRPMPELSCKTGEVK